MWRRPLPDYHIIPHKRNHLRRDNPVYFPITMNSKFSCIPQGFEQRSIQYISVQKVSSLAAYNYSGRTKKLLHGIVFGETPRWVWRRSEREIKITSTYKNVHKYWDRILCMLDWRSPRGFARLYLTYIYLMPFRVLGRVG